MLRPAFNGTPFYNEKAACASGGRAGDTAMLAISVSDTGIAMKPEFLDRIFDTFEQKTNDTTIR